MSLKPNHFDGLQDLNEYLSHFRLCSDINGWTDADRCKVLAAMLQGAARTYYMGLTEEDKSDYQSLISCLVRRFASENLSATYKARLASRRRQPGEDVRVLGDDILRMATRAFPGKDLGSVENSWIPLEHFLNSLEGDNQVEVQRAGCKSIYEAIEVVERYETSKQRSRPNGPPSAAVVRAVAGTGEDVQPAKTPSVPELAQLLEAIQKFSTKQDRLLEVQNRRPAEGGRSGAGPAQQRGPAARNPRREGCFKCGGLDHFQRECPNRQRIDARPGAGAGEERNRAPQHGVAALSAGGYAPAAMYGSAPSPGAYSGGHGGSAAELINFAAPAPYYHPGPPAGPAAPSSSTAQGSGNASPTC